MSPRHSIPFARPAIGDDEIAEVADSLRSGWIALGPKTAEFERRFAEYLGVPAAAALSSGTAGLHLALLALGIGAGDEVIVPTYTFASTAISALHVGATPVLVDVEPLALTMDPAAVRRAITSRTKAIVPVHIGGTAAEMTPLLDIAREHGLKVVEDAAHALPTRYGGKLIGTLGDVTVFSFYATKTLATGDGGMLVSRDPDVLARVRRLSLHGMDADAWRRYGEGGTWRYDVTVPGYKYNFTDIGASLGLHQLRKLDEHTARRTTIAERYAKRLAGLPGLGLPAPMRDSTHAWHLYLVRFDVSTGAPVDRDAAHDRLRQAGIGTSVHFIPLHEFTLFKDVARGPFPVADRAFREVLSLPIYPDLSDADVDAVADEIRGYWGTGKT